MKLNYAKTDFIIMGTANKLKKVIFNEIKIRQVEIKTVERAKNLEVMYDCEGILIPQVRNIRFHLTLLELCRRCQQF